MIESIFKKRSTAIVVVTYMPGTLQLHLEIMLHLIFVPPFEMIIKVNSSKVEIITTALF